MDSDKNKRRSFLKHILAGTAVVAGSVAAIRPAKAKPVSRPEQGDDILYKKSESFQKYYDSLK